MDTLVYRSAKALAAAIRSKEVSSYEVVTTCISQIEAVNPRINAVVQQAFDSALEQARDADDDLMRDVVRGPLHGLPMTIKDSLDTAGVITTAGTKGRATHVPDKDATVVARLRTAGAILLGKTNTPELTMSGRTDNYLYGLTNNPYDETRTPGGSSGGAAAIVAAGGAPFDIGSDTGGSIRIPAHCCGIAGIKPTAGRVPRTGHILAYDFSFIESLTHIGPLARYVEDLMLLLPIISGPDWYDPSIVPTALGEPTDVPLPQLRLAYYTDNGIASPTQDTVQVIHDCVHALSDSGVTCTESRPNVMEQLSMSTSDMLKDLVLADGGGAIRRILQVSGTDLNEIHPRIEWILPDKAATTLELNELIHEWNTYRSQMLTFLRDYDVLVCPASAAPAPKHDDEGPEFSYTMPYNLTGWPSVVLRAGTSAEGLPIGVQIVARPWREDVALAGALQIEKSLGGWQPPDGSGQNGSQGVL